MSAVRTRASHEGCSVRFRTFLRALAEEIDSAAGPEGRDALLRKIGHRMARLVPLPSVASMEALQMEINERLGELGWGNARLDLNEAEHCLVITHMEMPHLGAAGDPPGTWLSAVLQGLYEAWIAAQPGGDPALVAQRKTTDGPDVLMLQLSRT